MLVERLRAAGAIPIGKTNVPEFGMGSHSLQPRLRHDAQSLRHDQERGRLERRRRRRARRRDCCRSPTAATSAGRCAIRPTSTTSSRSGPPSGLIPMAPGLMPFLGFGVKGPMGRSVADVAWLLSVMAGPDPRDPACYPSDPSVFAGPLERDLRRRARGLVPGPRRTAARSARARRAREPAPHVRGARLHRRGGRART